MDHSTSDKWVTASSAYCVANFKSIRHRFLEMLDSFMHMGVPLGLAAYWRGCTTLGT